MPRGSSPEGEARSYLTDQFRRAAFDVCAAVRRLEDVTTDEAWRGTRGRVPAAAWADLRDATLRIAGVLRDAPKDAEADTEEGS